MLAKIRAYTHKDDGASAVEYGLLVAAIAALIVIVVFALGNLVSGIFDETCQDIKAGATTIAADCESPAPGGGS